MKFIFYFNLAFYTITFSIPLYYQEINSGLLVQFFLAIFHLLLGIFYIVTSKSKDSNIKQETGIYWLLVIGYFISLPLVYKLEVNKNILNLIMLFLIPLAIGFYNIYINYKIQKK